MMWFTGAAWIHEPRIPFGPRHWTGCWFRVLGGWGLHISNGRREDALIIDRYGSMRPIYAFGCRVLLLRPK